MRIAKQTEVHAPERWIPEAGILMDLDDFRAGRILVNIWSRSPLHSTVLNDTWFISETGSVLRRCWS
jgi:hypothetical protein